VWSWALLCFATVGAALLFGASHVPTLIGVGTLVCGAAVLVLHGRGIRRIPLPSWVLFGLAGYTLVQALPLPLTWVHALSPKAAEVWQRSFDVVPGGYASLSVDRGATLVEALKWATYGAGFIAAAGFGATYGVARGLALPLASAVILAAVTLAHGLVGASKVFGLYEPISTPSMWHIGPLLNPNHLAGYLNLGVFCGLGLLVARRPITSPVLLGSLVAFLIPNAIVAGSRGGYLGLMAGAAVFAFVLPRTQAADPSHGPVPKVRLLAMLGTVLAVAAGLTLLLASENTSRELYSRNVDKLKLLPSVWDVVRDHPIFGVGRGAFDAVFPAYRSGAENEIYTHPENIVAQWLSEWGVVVAVSGFAALSWFLRPSELGTKWSSAASGAVAGVAALLVQNLVDFSLEMPAIALAAVGSMGVSWGAVQARRGKVEVSEPPPRSIFAFLTGSTAVLGGLVLAFGAQPAPLERKQVAELYKQLDVSKPDDVGAFARTVHRAVANNPADPYFFRIAAIVEWHAKRDPMPWLQRSLERGPTIGRTHLMLARVLAARGAVSQALLALRYAASYDQSLSPVTARAAYAWTDAYSELLRAVPHGTAGYRVLIALARQFPGHAEQREQLLMAAVERDDDKKDAFVLLLGDLVHELELGDTSSRCAPPRHAECRGRASELLSRLERVAAGDIEPVLLGSRLLRVTESPEKALELLETRCGGLERRARALCFKARVEMAAHVKDSARFTSSAAEFVAENCEDVERCVVALERAGDLFAIRNDWNEALLHYQKAARERSGDALWMKVARAGVKVAAYSRVERALQRVRNRSKFEPEYSRLLRTAKSSSLAPVASPAAELQLE
jgi:tetratricopeptide (TPR) repeat protein